jgi:hypothetical protein
MWLVSTGVRRNLHFQAFVQHSFQLAALLHAFVDEAFAGKGRM